MSICSVHPRKAIHSRCDVLRLPDCGLGLDCANKHLQPILLYILSCHSSVCRVHCAARQRRPLFSSFLDGIEEEREPKIWDLRICEQCVLCIWQVFLYQRKLLGGELWDRIRLEVSSGFGKQSKRRMRRKKMCRKMDV
ncbi:hypothetical protein R1flu_010032 [Riccia fluitans]|uniref:Uncharacterized protein n=1 Tax=Riccia fluitans TaxID=41844 RepID=A0ABD1Z404_9MARC